MTQAYDLIGDIHGCARTLQALLHKLDYRPDVQGVYRHPDRQVIFLGDFIDRGPYQREAISVARRMMEAGQARSVMGNHEYNAIAFATIKDAKRARHADNYLRPHSAKNIGQHIRFLKAYSDQPFDLDADFEQWYAPIRRNADYQADIAWFKTLPLWLETDGIRVIHACWDQKLMARIGNPQLDDHLLHASSRPGNWQYEAIETLLKGKEIPLPPGHAFHDKDGNIRHHIRVRWWDQAAATYQAAFMGPESARTHIPHDEVSGDHLIDYGHDQPPLFLGHYWMNDTTPAPLSRNIACLDYSVAKPGGKLVAYRWQGERAIEQEHYRWADRVEWPGFNDTGSILLPLPTAQFQHLAPEIQVEGNSYKRKPEFHVTLMNKRLGRALERTVKHNPAQYAALEKAYLSNDWSLQQTDELRLIRREKTGPDGKTITQQSIVRMLHMPGLQEFYANLKQAGLLNPAVPLPPPHVTLYTRNCDSGISIPDSDALRNYTRHIFSMDSFGAHE